MGSGRGSGGGVVGIRVGVMVWCGVWGFGGCEPRMKVLLNVHKGIVYNINNNKKILGRGDI